MSILLLDVNVLIALFWPSHESHQTVVRWFARNSSKGWATCPFTQAAFVRISSNPAFSPLAVSPRDALNLLRANLSHPSHHFWRDEIGLNEAIRQFEPRLVGHQQIADAYLLGLALHRKGTLATLDRSTRALLPERSPNLAHIEIIPHQLS